jgi:hypothetical protein
LSLRNIVFAVLLFGMSAAVHACRFARDAQPAQWFEWANALFAADVTSIDTDAQKRLDVIAVSVVEVFKGPAAAATARLEVPTRMWASCDLERPSAGARVLVAMNPASDILLVPLTPGYAERLRAHIGKRP